MWSLSDRSKRRQPECPSTIHIDAVESDTKDPPSVGAGKGVEDCLARRMFHPSLPGCLTRC